MQKKVVIILLSLIAWNVVDSTIFNIRDFGAVGDGTTDDTASVLKAIDKCMENGGVLYIPSGMYVIRSTLTFKTNNQYTINGDGMSSVLLWEFNDHLINIVPGLSCLSIFRNVIFSLDIFRYSR